jgi:large subunit ribosomal protein L24e
MPRCSFCKQNYEFPRGLTLVLNDGNILYLCSSKCRKNMLHLRRDNKKVNWVRKSDFSETEAENEKKEVSSGLKQA